MHENQVQTILDKLLGLLQQNKPYLQSHFQVLNLAVFGSVARGESTPDSDIDILVEFPQAPTFDQFMDLKFFLEDLLHKKVDLVTKKGFRSELWPFVVSEMQYVP